MKVGVCVEQGWCAFCGCEKRGTGARCRMREKEIPDAVNSPKGVSGGDGNAGRAFVYQWRAGVGSDGCG